MAYKFNPLTGNLDDYGPVLTGTGTVSAAADGTAALPGIAFANDLNTGVYRPGADQLALATNGTGRFSIDANGNVAVDTNTLYVDAVNNRVAVGTTSPGQALHVVGKGRFQEAASSGAIAFIGADATAAYIDTGTYSSVQPLAFRLEGTERARLTTSGQLLVGTSTARSNFFNGSTYTPRLQLESATNGANSSIALVSAGNGGFNEPNLIFAKSRGNAIGDNTIVQSGDDIGGIQFQASDGTEYVAAAGILAEVDGTPGANDMPGRLVFSTTADGASSPTERMRVTQAGAVLVGTTTTPTGASSGAIVAQSKIVVGATGAGRHQNIVGTTGVITASTGTAIFNFSCTPSSSRAASIRLWVCTSAQSSGNTASNYAVAQYTFQLHQTAGNVISLNGATTLSEYTFVRATHLAFADLGNSTCNITLTNPTAVAQAFGYQIEILDPNGAWQLASVSVT